MVSIFFCNMALKRANALYESLYCLKLQMEREGQHVQALEAILLVNGDTQQLEMGFKDNVSFANHPSSLLQMYLPCNTNILCLVFHILRVMGTSHFCFYAS